MTNKEAMALFAEMVMNDEDLRWCDLGDDEVGVGRYELAVNIITNGEMNVDFIQDFLSSDDCDLFQGHSLS